MTKKKTTQTVENEAELHLKMPLRSQHSQDRHPNHIVAFTKMTQYDIKGHGTHGHHLVNTSIAKQSLGDVALFSIFQHALACNKLPTMMKC